MTAHHNHVHGAQNVKITRDEKAWEVELKAEISAEALDGYRAQALKEIQSTAKLDGFRPGKAPAERIIAVYGEAAILREAAEQAIQHELPELLAKEKLMIIESPRVEIGSPEAGKPLSFTARAPLAPEITLPDYKKIAAVHNAKKEEVMVSDKEHTDALTHLRRERARIDKVEAGAEPQAASEESRAMKEDELPALDDEFSKSIGYESAAHFTDTVRVNMREEKTRQAIEKRRTLILDDLIKESRISYPAILQEYEINEMEGRMKDDLERMGTTFEAYLNQTKKTHEEIRADWKDAADKRARMRLILAEISRNEKIEPDRDAFEQEVAHAKDHYKNADEGVLRTHIMHAMKNEAVLKFLEAQE
jgi:FKBP-type peptidyl-prolyl cis-trans isomerase (trigger factor)